MSSITNAATFEDAFNLLCGELIGSGIHRKVFECRLRKELIVKVEDNGSDWRYFGNVHEQKFWDDNEAYEPVAKWLAPCHYLSPDGRLLLQQRVDPIPSDYKLPEQVPTFLTDLCRRNYGLLDGRFVCVDYAMTIGTPSTRLKKADWD